MQFEQLGRKISTRNQKEDGGSLYENLKTRGKAVFPVRWKADGGKTGSGKGTRNKRRNGFLRNSGMENRLRLTIHKEKNLGEA